MSTKAYTPSYVTTAYKASVPTHDMIINGRGVAEDPDPGFLPTFFTGAATVLGFVGTLGMALFGVVTLWLVPGVFLAGGLTWGGIELWARREKARMRMQVPVASRDLRSRVRRDVGLIQEAAPRKRSTPEATLVRLRAEELAEQLDTVLNAWTLAIWTDMHAPEAVVLRDAAEDLAQAIREQVQALDNLRAWEKRQEILRTAPYAPNAAQVAAAAAALAQAARQATQEEQETMVAQQDVWNYLTQGVPSETPQKHLH